MFLAQDLDTQDAHWFYAEPALLGGVRHLVRKEQRIRHGPVLCGSLPQQPSENAALRGWWFLPFFGQPEEECLCPVCLQRWKTEQLLPVSDPLERRPKPGDQGKDAWYDV